MTELKRILLVEDSLNDIELTLSALEEHNLANEVVVTRDGEEALDYLCRTGVYRLRGGGNPAVILLDIKLPKLDGLEVLQRIKSDPNLMTTPVVMLTSSREERDLVKSYSLGVNAYVVKPVDFNEFIQAIRELGLFWAIINHPASRQHAEANGAAVSGANVPRAAEGRSGAEKLRILLLEDNPPDAELVQAALEDAGIPCDLERVETRDEFTSALERERFALILSDYRLPTFDGLSALRIAKQRAPVVPFLFVSGAMGEEIAIEAMKEGATDYILKDRMSRLAPSVRRALYEAEAERKRRRAERALSFLLDASTRLAALLDLDQIVNESLRLAVPRLGEWAAVRLIPDDRSGALFMAGLVDSGELDIRRLEARAKVEVPRSAIGFEVVAGDEKTLRACLDVSGEIPRLMERLPSRVIVAPLSAPSGVLGSLVIASRPHADHEPASDMGLFEDFARRVALAVENARNYREARDAVRARDEFLAIVSHDLRNPLQAIIGSSALMMKANLVQGTSRRALKPLETIQRASQRMSRMIEDLLDLARVEGGRLVLERAPVDARALVEEASEECRPLASERSITLAAEVEGEPSSLLVDRERALQVFSNILGNALKFTPEGGSVTLRARPGTVEVVFSVKDTGPGIAPEHLPHIFDRYWQAEQGSRKGVGLGLSIAKGIIEAHGGWIRVESAPGSGACFFFALPTVSSS